MVKWLPDCRTVFLEVTRDTEGSERLLDNGGITLRRVHLNSRAPWRDRESITTINVLQSGEIEIVEAIRAISVSDAVADIQGIAVTSQVEIGEVCIQNFGADTRRPLIVQFEGKSKRLRVLDVNVEDTLPGQAARL